MNAKDREFVMQDHDESLQAHAVFAEPHLLGGEEKAWLARCQGAHAQWEPAKCEKLIYIYETWSWRVCIPGSAIIVVHDTGNNQGIYDAASWCICIILTVAVIRGL